MESSMRLRGIPRARHELSVEDVLVSRATLANSSGFFAVFHSTMTIGFFRSAWRAGFLLCVALPTMQALAQAPTTARTPPQDPGQKTVHIVRTDTPPVIDGVLDDAVWANAAVIDDLHQVNPAEYAKPSERTEIRLLYDDDALYIGIKLYDSEPSKITANILRQNGSITSDDTIFVTLDPFNSRRAGYFFGVNPNGVRFDGLYRNVSEYYSDWDTIWDAKTSRFDQGWIVEYKIPYKSISFDPNTDTWGLNFSRTIQRRHEDIAWVSRNRRWDPSSSGLMVGLTGLKQGLGLDIVPSGSFRRKQTWGPGTETSDFQPSLDIAYKLTPQLNGLLTVNTDFSATEVDDRQVNLTRFGLFFPEKRDFFLREADIFEFGRIGASDNNGAVSGAERQNGRPFFSRRIGLSSAGEVVDLNYGGKISGRIGDRFELGALSIRQGEQPGVDAKTLSVVRAKAGIGEESSIGMIYTNGNPQSNVDNTLAGVDFLYRNSRLPGGRIVETGAWYQQTDTEGLVGHDHAAGVTFSVPSNTGLRGGVAVKEYQRNFNPALGFSSRTDVRDYAGHVGYTYRPSGGYWQSLYFVLDGERIENLSGGLQSQRIGLTPIQVTNRTGDVIWARANFNREVLTAPFEISPGVVIPVGDYSFDDLGLEFRFSGFRRVSGRITYINGDFYSGRYNRAFGNLTWQPSPHFRTSLGYDANNVTLPQGDFTTRIATAEFDIVFSSTWSWVNLIQYDNVSNTVGVNMRLHWIPQAGRELYFVINHNLQDFDRNGTFQSYNSEAVAKLSYTFRF